MKIHSKKLRAKKIEKFDTSFFDQMYHLTLISYLVRADFFVDLPRKQKIVLKIEKSNQINMSWY